MGAQVGPNVQGHGWQMQELPGQWHFNENAVRRFQRQQEEQLFQEMDRVSIEGFNPPRNPCGEQALQFEPSYVHAPELPLEANPMVRMDDIRTRRPSLGISPAQAARQIQEQENREILAGLAKYAQGQGPPPKKAHIFYPTAWERLLNEDPF